MENLALFGGKPVRTTPFLPWPKAGKGDLEALKRALEAGSWGGHPEPNTEAAAFAEKFAARHDMKYGICMNTGTEANRISMRAAGLQPGQEVILPSYNWISPITSVTACGADPVVVDIDQDTHLMDLTLLEAALSKKTAGVVSMHYTGRIVPPEPILEFCKKHGLFYVEDCAQAHGGRWKGKAVGSFGDAAAFSFQSSKILTAGEGGFVGTNNLEIANRAHAMVDNNRQKPWFTEEIRFPEVSNSRMSEFLAALLSSQLTRLDEEQATRQKNARLLHDFLAEIPDIGSLEPVQDETTPAYWKFVITLGESLASISKDVFLRALMAEGIPAEPGHVPVHIHPRTTLSRDNWILVSRNEGRGAKSLPVVEHLATRVHVWLPHGILLGSEKDMEDIATAVRKVRDGMLGANYKESLDLAKTTRQVWYESAEV
ncbi:MAG: DegT/DnrJ/EryC1/StrS family aminotransferase [Anaerolineae bacterium]|nr:DegT/DnrJ/EryC1/StrS family aminotransferase [Anaerolineae bacterium]